MWATYGSHQWEVWQKDTSSKKTWPVFGNTDYSSVSCNCEVWRTHENARQTRVRRRERIPRAQRTLPDTSGLQHTSRVLTWEGNPEGIAISGEWPLEGSRYALWACLVCSLFPTEGRLWGHFRDTRTHHVTHDASCPKDFWPTDKSLFIMWLLLFIILHEQLLAPHATLIKTF